MEPFPHLLLKKPAADAEERDDAVCVWVPLTPALLPFYSVPALPEYLLPFFWIVRQRLGFRHGDDYTATRFASISVAFASLAKAPSAVTLNIFKYPVSHLWNVRILTPQMEAAHSWVIPALTRA